MPDRNPTDTKNLSISWRENNQQMIFRIFPTHRRKIFNSYAESFHFMEGRLSIDMQNLSNSWKDNNQQICIIFPSPGGKICNQEICRIFPTHENSQQICRVFPSREGKVINRWYAESFQLIGKIINRYIKNLSIPWRENNQQMCVQSFRS